jgi:hypothetical protein
MGSDHWAHKVPGGLAPTPQTSTPRPVPQPRRPDPKFAFKLGPLIVEVYWTRKVKRAS